MRAERALAGYRQCWALLAEASLLGAAALGHGFGMVNFAIRRDRAGDGSGRRRIPLDGGGGLGLTCVTGGLMKAGRLAAAATAAKLQD